MDDLHQRLDRVKNIFDVNEVVNTKITKEYINRHYKFNKIPYSVFQDPAFLHVAIVKNGHFNQKDYLYGANLVAKYIKKLKARNVLELGMGRGPNSFYLAQKFPDIQFEGIDYSDTQVSFGSKKAKQVKNFHVQKCDYHSFKQFADNSFDIVFVVEALCYSSQKDRVLKEVLRVLRKGGVFVVLDGYSRRKVSELSKEELLAKKIVERGYALTILDNYQDFIDLGKKLGFKIVHEEDVTKYISYSLRKMERLAEIYFNHPRAAKLLAKILPKEITYNSSTGLLVPLTVKLNILCYYVTAFQK